MLTLLSAFTDLTVARLEYFFLILVRISFVIFLLPFFQSREVPTPVKSCLSLALAIVVWPMMPPVEIVVYDSLPHFFLLILEQCLVGIVIAFSANFILYFLHIAGALMAREMGITRIEAVEPVLDESADDLASLLLIVFSVLFLVKGHHHFFIEIILQSFQSIPPGMVKWNPEFFASYFTYMLSSSMLTGIRMAAPVLATVFLMVMGLALVSRIMPQMNVWIVGIPIKIAMGSVTLIYGFPLMSLLFESNFAKVQQGMMLLLRQQVLDG